MPNYKMVNADQLDADLKAVADSIREKSGQGGNLAFPSGFVSAVNGIETGGGGGGYSTCRIHVTFPKDRSGYDVYYSALDSNGNPSKSALYYYGEFDEIIGEYIPPSQNEYDIDVVCGSYMIIGDYNYMGVNVETELSKVGTGSGYGVFVPVGATDASIVIIGY